MKVSSLVVISGLLAASSAAFARDSSETIPAPTIEMRPAGAQPTPVAVVTNSQIPAPTIEVVPGSTAAANYNNYNADARGTTQRDDSEYRVAPSITVVR